MIANRFFSPTTLFLGCLLLALSAASCNKPAPASNPSSAQAPGKRYQLKGRVVSVDKPAGSVSVDAEAIPGFMDAMTMPYPVQPVSLLDQLSTGDAITADVVVSGDKYWLENVKVTEHATAPPAKPTAALHIPAVNEPVPDFKLINQSGKQISLDRYRGKALLVTFIYTRCPFPGLLSARQRRICPDQPGPSQQRRALSPDSPAQHQYRSQARHSGGASPVWLRLLRH